MSEENQNPEAQVDEKTLLKQQCKKLGIPVQGNLSVETLRQLVAEKLAGNEPTSQTTTDKETTRQRHKRIRDEATKLVRCRITCMNPAKKNMQGEIFSVGNKVIGTHKKFIPYSPSTHEEGYHIPNALYQSLKNRKYQFFREVKHDNGEKTQESVLINEFAIEVLPPLTEQELAELSKAQQAKGGL